MNLADIAGTTSVIEIRRPSAVSLPPSISPDDDLVSTAEYREFEKLVSTDEKVDYVSQLVVQLQAEKKVLARQLDGVKSEAQETASKLLTMQTMFDKLGQDHKRRLDELEAANTTTESKLRELTQELKEARGFFHDISIGTLSANKKIERLELQMEALERLPLQDETLASRLAKLEAKSLEMSKIRPGLGAGYFAPGIKSGDSHAPPRLIVDNNGPPVQRAQSNPTSLPSSTKSLSDTVPNTTGALIVRKDGDSVGMGSKDGVEGRNTSPGVVVSKDAGSPGGGDPNISKAPDATRLVTPAPVSETPVAVPETPAAVSEAAVRGEADPHGLVAAVALSENPGAVPETSAAVAEAAAPGQPVPDKKRNARTVNPVAIRAGPRTRSRASTPLDPSNSDTNTATPATPATIVSSTEKSPSAETSLLPAPTQPLSVIDEEPSGSADMDLGD